MKAVPYQSIPEAIQCAAKKYAREPAVSYKKDGKFVSLNYDGLYQSTLMAARGLRKAGLKPGGRVAILSENRTGWVIADLGTQAARGITVPIYATNTADQVEYVINHSGAEIVFISNRMQYEKLWAVRDKIPGVRHVFSFDRFLGKPELPVNTLYQLSEISHSLTEEEQREIEDDFAQLNHDDLITIIYTSGTTGIPKGVMLTQGNMLFNAHCAVEKLGGMDRRETLISFLPLSHVLERSAGYHAAFMNGCHIAFAESAEKVVENIVEIQPTMMVSVPRLFEKIYSRVYENVHLMNPLKRRMFHKAVEVGRSYVYCKYVQQKKTGILGVKYRVADRLIFRKIRARFGGRLRLCICGGAPLDKTINEFMWIIGIPTCEGYGLTETSPAVTLNSFSEIRFGSVGRLLGQTEARLASDGELQIKGPQVMRGYYQNIKATDDVLMDGWLSTGDIAKIDDDGYIYIVDRKKEIIVTAGGKNIAPHPIENELKLDKYISQAFVFGDRKPYLVALITPTLERLIELAKKENINYFDLEDLVTNDKVYELFKKRIAVVNAKLPPYETIKRFVVLPREFSVEGGELTPTLKLKRKVIIEKYQEKIHSLYQANGKGVGNQHDRGNGGKYEAN